MTDRPLAPARWISRTVAPSQRVWREVVRDRIDWAEPGEDLSQAVAAAGRIVAVGVDIAAPRDVPDPFAEDVEFSLSLVSSVGETVAEKVEGPADRVGTIRPVDRNRPPVPPGNYSVVLRVRRATIGWYTAEPREPVEDDGVSPVPISGSAYRNGEPVAGTRLIVIDTPPAPNPVFRTTIEVDGSVREADLAATVVGCAFVRVNGRRVGEPGIELAVTEYDRTVLYRTAPVGHLPRQGINEITIEAGRERYAARGGDTWGWYAASWHEPVDDPRVTSASIRHRTPRGEADVRWERGAGGWSFRILVPVGSSAHVRVPGSSRSSWGPGRHSLEIGTPAPGGSPQ